MSDYQERPLAPEDDDEMGKEIRRREAKRREEAEARREESRRYVLSAASTITLREAIERYQRQPGAYANAYSWYLRHLDATVHIHGTEIPVAKIGRSWTVSEADVNKVFDGMRQASAEKERRTADYAQHVLHRSGGTTTWGGYSVTGDFHFAWNDMMRLQKRSDGAWFCNGCWEPAKLEHGGEECHRCRDWSPCGNDCTLTRVYCPDCGTSLAR